MITAKIFAFALFFAALFSTTLLQAQAIDSLFPQPTVIQRPDKPTPGPTLTAFVNQSFELAEKTTQIRSNLSAIFLQLMSGKLDSLLTLRTKFADCTSGLQGLIPSLQNLISIAPDLLTKGKSEIRIWDIPRAISNFNSARKALQNAFKNGSFLLTTTIPYLTNLFPKSSKPSGDTTKVAAAGTGIVQNTSILQSVVPQE